MILSEYLGYTHAEGFEDTCRVGFDYNPIFFNSKPDPQQIIWRGTSEFFTQKRGKLVTQLDSSEALTGSISWLLPNKRSISLGIILREVNCGNPTIVRPNAIRKYQDVGASRILDFLVSMWWYMANQVLFSCVRGRDWAGGLLCETLDQGSRWVLIWGLHLVEGQLILRIFFL